MVNWINKNVGFHHDVLLLCGVYYDGVLEDGLMVVASVNHSRLSNNWCVILRNIYVDFWVQFDTWWVHISRVFNIVLMRNHLVARFGLRMRVELDVGSSVICSFINDGGNYIWRNDHFVRKCRCTVVNMDKWFHIVLMNGWGRGRNNFPNINITMDGNGLMVEVRRVHFDQRVDVNLSRSNIFSRDSDRFVNYNSLIYTFSLSGVINNNLHVSR